MAAGEVREVSGEGHVEARGGAEPEPRVLWQLARDEAAAAAVVAFDPMVRDRSLAAGHLIKAWRLLVGATGGTASIDPGELAGWLRDGRLPQLGEKRRVAVAEFVERVVADPARLRPRAIRSHLRRLEQVVADVGADVAGWSSRREHQLRWVWRGVVATVVLVLLVAWGLAWRDARAPGPWRGAYFPGREFKGVPIVRRDRDIDFDWRDGRPMPRIREDSFSVRWDSCLDLPEPITAAFQLISNNGSRLFIDGQLVIDNWDNNFTRTRGGEVDLSAGIHHLRVEYWEGSRTASVTLLASLDGQPPKAIPRSMLRYPDDGGDMCPTK